MSTPGTRRKDGNELAAGYSFGHRLYELGGMALATSMAVYLGYRLAHSAPLSGWWVPLALLCGMLFADFISGFFHWGFDTWGGVDTPVLGKLAIRTFREHHVDQKSITRHDFVETNGHNFALTVISTGSGLLFMHSYAGLGGTFFGMSALAGTIFVAFTSQIHKYAHMDEPPRVIAFLQRMRILLSKDHHQLHHSAPYDRNYCITVGWMNGPLRAIRFFETLEKIISLVTGAVPREDDIGKEAALELEASKEEEAKANVTNEA